MGPSHPQDFNPDQNPFEAILAGMGGAQGQAPQGMPAGMPQGMPPMGPGEGSPAGMPQLPQGGPQMPGQPPMPGQDPKGGTKFLISALQNLHQYLGAAQDEVDVAAVRGLIQIMTRLISRDQENMMKNSQPPMGGTPPMPGGAPQGMPAAGGPPKPPMPGA